MVYAESTGAVSRDNLLQYLADGEALGSVCATVAAGCETLASLFAAASTKQIVEIDTLDDISDTEFQECETGSLRAIAPRPLSGLEAWT